MIELIEPVLDVLFLLIVLRFVWQLVRSVRAPAAGPRQAGARRAPPRERDGGTLVRDPQCGTYIAESRALRVESGDHTVYFCSAKCRDAYAAGHS